MLDWVQDAPLQWIHHSSQSSKEDMKEEWKWKTSEDGIILINYLRLKWTIKTTIESIDPLLFSRTFVRKMF